MESEVLTFYAVSPGAITATTGCELPGWDFFIGDDRRVIFSDQGMLRWLDATDPLPDVTTALENHLRGGSDAG